MDEETVVEVEEEEASPLPETDSPLTEEVGVVRLGMRPAGSIPAGKVKLGREPDEAAAARRGLYIMGLK